MHSFDDSPFEMESRAMAGEGPAPLVFTADDFEDPNGPGPEDLEALDLAMERNMAEREEAEYGRRRAERAAKVNAAIDEERDEPEPGMRFPRGESLTKPYGALARWGPDHAARVVAEFDDREVGEAFVERATERYHEVILVERFPAAGQATGGGPPRGGLRPTQGPRANAATWTGA